MNQLCCTKCPNVDVNEMTDERYCSMADYKPIRLWRRRRPNWCPRLKQRREKRGNGDEKR